MLITLLLDPSFATCAPSLVSPDHFALLEAAMADPAPLRRWSTATATATTKLRDSCSACASSKVKCTKEKPACSRCAKRGTTCDYLVTKRPGRKQPPHPIHLTTTPPNTNATHDFDSFSWSTTLSGSTAISSASPTAVQQTPTNGDIILPVSSELFHGLLSPVDTSMFSDLDPMSTDFLDFISPSVSFPLLPDPPDVDLLNTPYAIFGDQNGDNNNNNNSSNSNSNSKDSVEDTIHFFGSEGLSNTQKGHLPVAPPGLASAPSAPPAPRSSLAVTSIRPFTTLSTEQHKGTNNGSPPCACLTRTLDLLKLLVACDVSPQASSCNQIHDRVAEYQLATVDAVNAMNKQTIDALSHILQCACSTDTYLLTIASLVVFRMLNGYAQVAQAPAALNDVEYDGEDPGRVAAQSVLGELHLVQCLVNQLSSRLRACVSRRPCRQDNVGFFDESPSPTRASETSPAFFYPVLDQLESELRSRIRSLSSEIIALLQRD
jgi:hypothetical protein